MCHGWTCVPAAASAASSSTLAKPVIVRPSMRYEPSESVTSMSAETPWQSADAQKPIGQPVMSETVGLATTIRTRLGVVVVRSMAAVIACASLVCSLDWGAVDNTKRVRKENAARAPRGRPRSAAVDEAILEAALAEMAEQGYARMSVDAVASRAGVSKPTLYLRHPSKAALATAAVASLRSSPRPEPTGDTRADLVALLRLFRSGVERPYGIAMIGTVLAEEAHTPELMRLFRERLVEPRRRGPR